MKEYKDYWFHIKGSLIGCLYGLPACLLAGFLVMILPNNKSNDKPKKITGNKIDTNTIILEKELSEQNDYIESEYDKMKTITNIYVTINGKTYDAKLEENETAQSFANMLPEEFQMNELNGNEKYVNLDNTFPTNSYYPKYIEAGDIMLYGSNCLVVFYKSFDTTFSYTKIGHIENLPDLGNKNITIKFEE